MLTSRRRPPQPATDVPSTVLAPGWPVAQTVAVYIVLFAGMTWRWIVGDAAIPWDAKAHFQPQIQFLAHSIARGEWPWWNPYVFAGHPQIADPQSMIFSPPFLLLALVNGEPSSWAIDMTLLAAMCAGGAGMIVYFRERGWHWAGALIAALAFSFGAAMAWRLQHFGQVLSLAYLPWVLVFLDRAIIRGSIVAGALAGLFAAFIVLGRDQVALLAMYFLAGYAIWRLASDDRPRAAVQRAIVPLAAGALVGALLVTPPLLMTLLLAAESNRPSIDFIGAGRGSMHPALLLTLISPDVFGAAGSEFWGPPSFAWGSTDLFTAQNVGVMYVGAIPLLLIAAAVLSGRAWDREVRFFTIALVFMLLYALGWYTPAFRLFYEVIPGVDLYRRPADAVFMIGAMLALIAGYAGHRLFAEPWRGLSGRSGAVLAILFAASLGGAVFFGWQLDRLHQLAVPLTRGVATFAVGALLLVWARSRLVLQPATVALTLAALTAADLAINNGNNGSSALPRSNFEVLEPHSRNSTIGWLKSHVRNEALYRDRVELAGLGFHWPNASMTHGLDNTLGYNPVRLGLYSRATGAEDHVGLPDQRAFSALMPSYRSTLANLLGLRYIVAGVPIEKIDERLAPDAFPLVHRTRDAWIYENPHTLPRVLFATRAISADFEVILQSGQWPDADFRDTVLLEGDQPSRPDARPGTARLVSYANTRVEIEVDSPDGGYLVLNDVWHAWWRAEIDGSPAPIMRANVLFRAVAVPPGRHRVVFTFRPLVGTWDELIRGAP